MQPSDGGKEKREEGGEKNDIICIIPARTYHACSVFPNHSHHHHYCRGRTSSGCSCGTMIAGLELVTNINITSVLVCNHIQ